jgi:hypothetical protein
MSTRTRWIIATTILVLFGGASPILTQEPPTTLGIDQEVENFRQALKAHAEKLLTDPAQRPKDTDTLNDYRTRIFNEIQKEAATADSRTSAKAQAKTPAAIAGKTTSTTSPEGFPERVRESIADFLPLLGLSMDAVSTSDDRKSVSLNLATSAAEPEVFKPFLEKVIEPLQDQEKKALLTKVDDLDDVTFALAFGYARSRPTWERSRHLYGRDFSRYQKLIKEFSNNTWSSVESEMIAHAQQASQFRVQFLEPLKFALAEKRKDKEEKAKAAGQPMPKPESWDTDVWETPFSEIRERIKVSALKYSEEDMIKGFSEESLDLATIDRKLGKMNFDALPSLIDNQPQIVFTVAQRAADRIMGPEATTVTARYEMGSNNLNAVLREYHDLKAAGMDDKEAQIEAYKTVVNGDMRGENKFLFSLSHKWVSDYSFQHDYEQELLDPATGDPKPEPILRTAMLELPKSEEWRGSLTFTRFLLVGSDPTTNQTGVDLPRITITVEAVQLRDDPTRQNRVIGKISYVQPASKGISIPITLTYASRSEFLVDQDRTFGAHLGLTYKLGGSR